MGTGTARCSRRGWPRVDEVFNGYLEWIQETMTTERAPWLKVICVMVGEGTTVVTDSAATTPSRAGSAEDSPA